jgi:transposase
VLEYVARDEPVRHVAPDFSSRTCPRQAPWVAW